MRSLMYRFTPMLWTECGFHLLPWEFRFSQPWFRPVRRQSFFQWKSCVLNDLTTYPNSVIWPLTCTLSPPVLLVRPDFLAPRRGARMGPHKSLILRMLSGSQNGSLRRAFPYPSSWTKVETFPVNLTRRTQTTDPRRDLASNSIEGRAKASPQ